MAEVPKRLYKFGRTNSEDIMERFSLEVHLSRGWANTPLSRDYTVAPLWSTWVEKEEARDIEKWYKETYPKTFYCEIQYNGIGECRDWDPVESYKFSGFLKEKYPKDNEYWQKIEDLKAKDILHATCDKIYFVMLTKK